MLEKKKKKKNFWSFSNIANFFVLQKMPTTLLKLFNIFIKLKYFRSNSTSQTNTIAQATQAKAKTKNNATKIRDVYQRRAARHVDPEHTAFFRQANFLRISATPINKQSPRHRQTPTQQKQQQNIYKIKTLRRVMKIGLDARQKQTRVDQSLPLALPLQAQVPEREQNQTLFRN